MQKLLIVSSHHITAFGLELLLKSKNKDLDVQTVTTGSMVLEQLDSSTDMPMIVAILEPNVLELAAQVLKVHPTLRILAVTGNVGMPTVQRLYSGGIKGVVDIANPSEVILHAVDEVMAGQTFLEEKFKSHLLQTMGTASSSRTLSDTLTKREEEVIGLMLKGKKMGEISSSLNLKPSTISTFKTKIYEKLGVSSVLELKEVYAPHY